jgi:hypothetical protein
VEIDISESDLSKISLKQKCRVSPEAYPDKVYQLNSPQRRRDAEEGEKPQMNTDNSTIIVRFEAR